MASQLQGIDITDVGAATGNGDFRLGTIAGLDTADGYKEYIYGRAAGAITAAGYVCVEATGFDFAMATVTNTAPGQSGYGSRIAIAQNAMADNQFGWFQIYGKGSVRTLASAAKGTQLNSTATAGVLDDDATTGAEAISGIVLGTATGGAEATNADAYLTYPAVDRTL
jgi:hypothetical protein